MKADQALAETVRRSRRGGRVMLAVLGLVALVIVWRMAQVSEEQAFDTTRGRLEASLNALAAEHMARGQMLDMQWSRRNPFELLRWRQDDYCGALEEDETPGSGCWYWLPAQGWLIYRMRYRLWSGQDGGIKAYRLLVLSGRLPSDERSPGAAVALELEAVPLRDLSQTGLVE